MLFRCKGCKLGELTIEKTISHFKLCEARTDNWGYRVEHIYQKKSDEFDKILEAMQHSDDEIEIDSIISQKELMESSASSSSPFQRTTVGEQYTVDTSTGNVSRKRIFRTAGEPLDNVKPSGKRMTIEEPIILQEGGHKGKILNIAANDSQRWNSVIDLSKGIVVADYIKTYNAFISTTKKCGNKIRTTNHN